ncbi:MAG: hypothetical protein FWE02_04960 [Defluviitaleaceae bacterium]|nr:hypothetical protein [Defluviitaleaceae bacterium]
MSIKGVDYMDFYVIERDNRLHNPIKVSDIIGFFDANISDELEKDDFSAKSLFLNEAKDYEYVDFIFFDHSSTILYKIYRNYLMISDKYKVIFSKYNQKILFKPIALIDKSKSKHQLYWIIKIEPSTKISLQERIIHICLKNENKFIVTLEVVESILRRSCLGVAFQKIEKGVYQDGE